MQRICKCCRKRNVIATGSDGKEVERKQEQWQRQKRLLTYAGLKAIEDELENLKVVKRKEVAGKIKEAREQGDLSENAEYDAAKDEQRDIEAPYRGA